MSNELGAMKVILMGKVLRGDGYGKQIGFPTANIDRRQWSRLKVKPKLGVYAGTTRVGKKLYKAGIVVGPLDSKSLPKLESHLIGFRASLYNQKIAIELHEYLHSFTKYKTEVELKRGIAQDIKKVKVLIKL